MEKKIYLKIILQCIIFALISCACSSGIHAFNSAFIEGVHGKPSFVSNTLFIYSFYTKLSFAIVYVLIGRLIPVKNRFFRSFIYIALIWGSNFMPQIMGLAFADGEIAQEAFSASIVICDSIGYLVDAIILGLIVNVTRDIRHNVCSKSSLLKTSLISMIIFPLLIIIMDTILRTINVNFGGRAAMGVSKEQAISFYIGFYSYFLVTGALLPLFYRLTLYNDTTKPSLTFGLIYSIGIWTPIVLIMIVFGTEVLPTVIYTIAFMIAFLIITYINANLLNRFEKGKGLNHVY